MLNLITVNCLSTTLTQNNAVNTLITPLKDKYTLVIFFFKESKVRAFQTLMPSLEMKFEQKRKEEKRKRER